MMAIRTSLARSGVLLSATAWIGLLSAFSGCGGDGPRREFLDVGTAPGGGVFYVMGTTISQVLDSNLQDQNVRVQAKGSGGSMENIRRLTSGDFQLGMSNSAISYFARRGEGDWDREHDIRAVVTLAPNIALFITRADSGIRTIGDLRGKRVVVGPDGAGFEQFVAPILQEHGLSMNDFTRLNASQTESVDWLGDGSADAAFLGGAVPTAAIAQAAGNMDIHFIPYDEDARRNLVEKYPFFHPEVIPAVNRQGEPTYPGMTEDFHGLDVGKMHLIAAADLDEELVYLITRTIWEQREEITRSHPAGRAINEQNAARYTGTEFHPGAERFYREIGIWPEE